MATVPKTFAEDFELWAASLLEDGDTPEGIEEIRQEIRDAFAKGGDAAAYWMRRVVDEAACLRSLRAPRQKSSNETHRPTTQTPKDES